MRPRALASGDSPELVPDLRREDLAVLIDRERVTCVRHARIERGIVEGMAPQDHAARAWNAQRAHGIPNPDEVWKGRVAAVHRKALVALAELRAERDPLPLLFFVPVVLVDLLDRLLDQRQSAFLVLTVARTVSRGVALRNAAQRQHAAETAHREGAAAEPEQKNPVTGFIVFDERGVAVLDILRDPEAGRLTGEIVGPTPPLAFVLRAQSLVVERYLLRRGSRLGRIPELPDIGALRFRHAGALAGAVGKYHDVLRHVVPPRVDCCTL